VEKQATRPALKMPIVITVVLIVVVSVLFLYEFVIASTVAPEGELTTLTADNYLDIVQPLLQNADVARGKQLVEETYECHVCHIQNGGQIAPLFIGLGERAAQERPPLTAEAYLYESIAYPTAHMVEGYSAAMPANYPTRLSSQEMGDMIVYLLTQ
jgi:mono/diheme cytochrome c family protein